MVKRAEGLNYIRLLCMLMILLFHAKIIYGFQIGVTVLDEIISIGAIAIVGFFMMSGFCLRHQYRGISIISTGGGRYYLEKRLLGIYPAFLFLLLCALIFNYSLGAGWQDVIKILPMELSLLHITLNPLLNNYFFNTNTWYLSALFVLYLLFPYFNDIVDRLSKKCKIILCVLLPIISWYIYYLNMFIVPGNAYLFYYVNPLFRIPEFFVGMLASDIMSETRLHIKWWQVTGATLLAAIIIHFLYPYWNGNNIYNLYNIIAIPYFLFLLLAAAGVREGTIVGKLAANKCIKYITSLGLGVYLCQSLSIMVLAKGWLHIPCRADMAFMILTIIFAIFLHEIIEKPSKKIFQLIKGKKGIHEKK